MLANLLSPEGFKDMSIEQILQVLEKFGINVPEILGNMETGLLNQAERIRRETGKNVLLVMEPNSNNDQVQVTIYKDNDGYGDLVPYQQFAFRNLMDLFKNQPPPNTNITPHEELKIEQTDNAYGGTGSAAGAYTLIGPASNTDPEPGSACAKD